MRKTIRKAITVLLALLLVLSIGMPAFAAAFSDVATSHWGYSAIDNLSTRGVFVGYADGTFKPESTITYAEFTAIVTRAYYQAHGLSMSGAPAGGQWYEGIFALATTNNIITANQFAGKENAPITRSDIVLLISNALPDAPVPANVAATLDKFSDAASLKALSAVYQNAIAKIADAAIVVGDNNGRFNPSASATRAEAAAFVANYLGYSPAAPVTDGKIMIAAAASLRNAFEKSLIPAFAKLYPGIEVVGTFDSSGKLQTQIEEGLEADIFFSAALAEMNNLKEKNLMDADTIVNMLENKVVLIGTKGVKTSVTGFENITAAPIIAIGDPDSVPAGRYAKEVFASLGIWDDVLAKSSLGTNVTEVLTQVAAGSAEVGVVYATDAASNADVVIIAEAPDGSLKTPILYPIGITAESKNKPQAKAFLDFLKSDAAKAIFESYGFAIAK
jgi:molybdate transport system substrate-binding protein